MTELHLHFDLDGTLADTETHFVAGWKARARASITTWHPALDEATFEDLFAAGYQRYGCPWRGLEEDLRLPQGWAEQFYAIDGLIVAQAEATRLPPTPHLPELLAQAQTRATLAILTQGHADYARHVLAHQQLNPYFATLRDRAYKRTPAPYERILAETPSPTAQHWLIEDSPANLPMAKQFGFTTVLVGPREGVADHHFADVGAFLRALLKDQLP